MSYCEHPAHHMSFCPACFRAAMGPGYQQSVLRDRDILTRLATRSARHHVCEA